MILLLTGSRDLSSREIVWSYLSRVFERTGFDLLVRHGDCETGADKFAHQWCQFYQVPVDPMPADWERYGNAAGPIRNRGMAERGGDFWVAFWLRGVKGTKNAVGEFADAGISGRVIAVKGTR